MKLFSFGASNTIFHSQPTHTTPFALRVFLGFSNSRRQRLRFGCSSKSIYSNMRVWWHQTKCDSNVLMCVCWMAWTEVKWMRSASTLGHFAWLYDTPTQPTTFFNLLFLSALTTLSLAPWPSRSPVHSSFVAKSRLSHNKTLITSPT